MPRALIKKTRTELDPLYATLCLCNSFNEGSRLTGVYLVCFVLFPTYFSPYCLFSHVAIFLHFPCYSLQNIHSFKKTSLVSRKVFVNDVFDVLALTYENDGTCSQIQLAKHPRVRRLSLTAFHDLLAEPL